MSALLSILVGIGGDKTAPTFTSATIPAAGTSISLLFSEAVSVGAGGNGGFTITLSGGACTLTYSSGSGSNTLVYTTSRTVNSGETCSAFAYTQPGNGIEDASGNDLATFSGRQADVTNNSTQSAGPTEVASDAMNYGTNGSIGANWEVLVGSFVSWGTNGTIGSNSSGHNAARWQGAGTFNADQYSECTVSQVGIDEIGVIARAAAGSSSYYFARFNNNLSKIQLYRRNAGVATLVADPSNTASAGHKLRLEVSGTGSATRCVVKKDTGSGWETAIASIDPGGTYIDSGNPGIHAASATGSSRFDSWAGGNL